MARDTRRSLDDALAVASIFESDSSPAGDGSTSDAGWLDRVHAGFEPITKSTLGTLDVLRSVVPGESSDPDESVIPGEKENRS